MKKIAIAIDGPAAAGKSTVAKIVAEKLQYVYIYTGAMYRAVTLYVLDHQIDVQNDERISKILPNITITFEQQTDGQHVYLNGVDITDVIRSTSVSNKVSLLSSYSSVLDEMVCRQQDLVSARAVELYRRDYGTT